jgi:hypothetical protein
MRDGHEIHYNECGDKTNQPYLDWLEENNVLSKDVSK